VLSGSSAIASKTKIELEEARKSLEMLSGKLKVADAERRSTERLHGEIESVKAGLEAERREKESLNAQIIADANARLQEAGAGADAQHPIFGELVMDLGYKRVYKSDPATVWAATPIWEKQRAFRQERCAQIARAKLQGKTDGWPGTIAVCEIVNEGTTDVTGLAVIDGQHRLGAAHMLSAKGELVQGLQDMTVELYIQMTTTKANALFAEINKVQPVKIVDLEPGFGKTRFTTSCCYLLLGNIRFSFQAGHQTTRSWSSEELLRSCGNSSSPCLNLAPIAARLM
jgi:hypothetical protein